MQKPDCPFRQSGSQASREHATLTLVETALAFATLGLDIQN